MSAHTQGFDVDDAAYRSGNAALTYTAGQSALDDAKAGIVRGSTFADFEVNAMQEVPRAKGKPKAKLESPHDPNHPLRVVAPTPVWIKSLEVVDNSEALENVAEDDGPAGERFDTVDDLLRVAAKYWMSGAETVGRVLPDEMQTSHLMLGLEVPHQAALFVESTDHFERARLALWMAYRIDGCELRYVPRSLWAFMRSLNARLPWTFFPPAPDLCGWELERMERAAEAARLAQMEAKHRKSAPGFAKNFRGFNESWNENQKTGVRY